MSQQELPVTPYAGTSGHASTPTSVEGERWRRGKQAAILDAVRKCQYGGCTSPELERWLGIGHGAASGALSALHKSGRLARLALSRGGPHRIYVVPQYVNGRPTEPHGRRRS